MRFKSSMPHVRFATAAMCAVGALSVAVPAAAQAPSDTSAELEAVVVTANRRNEAMQDVPVAVSAFSEAAIKQLGIADPRGLANLVPGFQANRVGIFPATFLRGIGSSSSGPTIETAVATFIDDVYIPASASTAMANFDAISSMEVLKGPQGTLFGRNATGGVINIHTKNPSRDASIEMKAGYANYDTRSGSVYATGPLTDTISANVAVYGRKQHDGWGRNVITGEDVNLAWNYGARIKILAEPSDSTTALLTVDYDRTRSDLATVNRVAPGTLNFRGIGGIPGFYDSNLDSPSFNRNKQRGISLKVTQDLGFANLVSISAYRKNNGFIRYDSDFGPTPFVISRLVLPQRTYTQELQLVSSAESKVDWIVGAFYFDDKGGYNPSTQAGGSVPATLAYSGFYSSQHTKSISAFGQFAAEVLPRTRVTLGLRYTRDNRELRASGVLAPASGAAPVITVAANSPQERTWSKISGRIGLDYKVTDDLMVYAAFNRGFRAGLFNPTVSPGALIAAPVEPEVLDAYTAGFKSEFWDNRIRLNLEAFHYTYKNLQLQQLIGVATFITNAAEATYKGVDIDLTVKPTRNFTLTGALEVMEGKYGSYPNGLFNVYNPAGGNCTFTVVPAPGVVPCGGRALPPNYNPVTGTWDLKGNQTIQTPPVSFAITGQYVIDSPVGPLTTNLTWSYKGRYYFDGDNGKGQVAPSSPDNDRQRKLHLLKGSVDWTAESGRWGVRVWGENLTNEKYWAFASEGSPGTRNNAAEPRTYGVTLTVSM